MTDRIRNFGAERAGHPARRRLGRWSVLAAVAALALTACGGGDDDGASETADTMPASDARADEFSVGDEAADAPADDGATEGGNPAGVDLGSIGRDVIVEMYVTVSSDDIERSVSAVTARAAALGGGVASSEVDFGRSTDEPGEGGYAVLVVRVPPASIAELLSGLERAGTILSVNQNAQDVTDQLVDLDVRIANARESVESVRRFMERTEDLSELVTLEGELTRRQTELEQLEAQERNLSDRVALSTVTIEIIPTALAPEADDDDSLGGALRRGWDGFVAILFGIVWVLAVLLPFLVTGALIAAVVLWFVRRSKRPAATADAVASEPDDGDPASRAGQPGATSDHQQR